MNNKKKQKKFLLALPMLVFPFITLGFWALGGGQVSAHNAETTKGLNVKLPDAHNATTVMDKMSYYNQAALDSIKRKEQANGDPYFRQNETAPSQTAASATAPGSADSGSSLTGVYHDQNEARVYEKLASLQNALRQQPAQNAYQQQNISGLSAPSANTMDVERLEQMMKAMQASPSNPDPETAQLNAMLEKILDIQHPDRMQEKLKENEQARKGRVFAVTAPEGKNRVFSLEAKQNDTGKAIGFYGLDDSVNNETEQNAIGAVVHENQTLVNGATIKLRLTDDILIGGTRIPKNNFVFGTAQLNGERLTIKISSIRFRKSLFPVQLSVFDIDGLDGIYIPGAIARDVAKQSADRSLQNIGLTSYDPSLGAQAMSAGIEATKTLLSKNVKLIKVFVKAGYQVLLRDEKQKDDSN